MSNTMSTNRQELILLLLCHSLIPLNSPGGTILRVVSFILTFIIFDPAGIISLPLGLIYGDGQC